MISLGFSQNLPFPLTVYVTGTGFASSGEAYFPVFFFPDLSSKFLEESQGF